MPDPAPPLKRGVNPGLVLAILLAAGGWFIVGLLAGLFGGFIL